ncbi:MAG TPA: hypothetical protein VE971_03440, partial [Candidatus Eisenbacteria bacterium]|nr:hypothetical protein [Candidatus Eisenbacteria bacterium]
NISGCHTNLPGAYYSHMNSYEYKLSSPNKSTFLSGNDKTYLFTLSQEMPGPSFAYVFFL